MSEENKPREFIIQRGSFCYVIVERLDSNPDWANKPFKVIEMSAYQALEARHMKLLEVLNNQIKRGYPTGGEWSAIENEVKKARCVE